MEPTTKIPCPKCGEIIDINSVLIHKISEEKEAEYLQKSIELKKVFQSKADELNTQKELLEKSKLEIKETISKQVQQQVQKEKTKVFEVIRTQIEEEKSLEISSYKEQLEQKTLEAKNLNKLKADYEKLNREKGELQEKIQAESEIKYSQSLKDAKENIRKDLEEKNKLKVSEKQHVIDQLQEQLREAQRKAEQGSMQIQGEVQEMAIEDYLRANFVLDEIEEIKKGAKGGDCLQIIHTRERQNCGSIYYESKRTKDFQTSWIEKFKADMRERGATFGVLITEAMPKDMDMMGQRDGVWICTMQEFKGLCFVLREAVVMLNSVYAAQENKGGKMELLYGFLTGSEFRMQIEAIVEGFTQMQEDLNAERRAMESTWKKREKQIQKVLLYTAQMHGSIKGIAGNIIREIKQLSISSINKK